MISYILEELYGWSYTTQLVEAVLAFPMISYLFDGLCGWRFTTHPIEAVLVFQMVVVYSGWTSMGGVVLLNLYKWFLLSLWSRRILLGLYGWSCPTAQPTEVVLACPIYNE